MIQQTKRPITVRDVFQMQLDVKNLLAESLLPQWLQIIATDSTMQREEYASFLSALKEWNFRMEKQSIAATIFEVWMQEVIRLLFQEELGPKLFQQFVDHPTLYIRLFYQVIRKGSSAWFHQEKFHDKKQLLVLGFQRALERLRKTAGEDIANWQWGRVHQLHLQHVLGQVKVFHPIFSRGSFPVPGSIVTVNVATYLWKKPFEVRVGPSMRFVVDFASPSFYYAHFPGGNSGNPFSPFYDNQIHFWLRGEYFRIPFRRTFSPQFEFNYVPTK